MTSFEGWLAELGPVTKLFLATTVGSTAGMTFGLFSPEYLLLSVSDTFMKLQLWRPLTSVAFLGKFGFPWLINVAMLIMYVKNHEDAHPGRLADLVWMFTVVISVLHAIGTLLGMQLLSMSFIMALVWIYCRRNEDMPLKIYSFQFRAAIFPWALTAFHLVLGQDIAGDIIGIIAGHVYFFLHDVQPLTNGGVNYIGTPAFLKTVFPPERMGARGLYTQTDRRPGQPPANQGPHRWEGAGRRLGGPE